MAVSNRGNRSLLRKEAKVKNLALYMVVAIVALVILASFLKAIIVIAAAILVIGVGLNLAMRALRRHQSEHRQ